MVSENRGRDPANGMKTTRWGVVIALVLITAIALFTGFESHLL
jgi:hypothetical protein